VNRQWSGRSPTPPTLGRRRRPRESPAPAWTTVVAAAIPPGAGRLADHGVVVVGAI